MASSDAKEAERSASYDVRDTERWASSNVKDTERWDQVFESIDLLFAKMGEMRNGQQRMATQIDISTQVLEQVLLSKWRLPVRQ